MFEENKLLKLDDITKLEHLKLVFLFKNGDLPNELNTLFKLNVKIHQMQVKGASALLRSIQLLLTVDLLGIPHLLHGMNVSNQLKTFMKKLYINSYKCK